MACDPEAGIRVAPASHLQAAPASRPDGGPENNGSYFPVPHLPVCFPETGKCGTEKYKKTSLTLYLLGRVAQLRLMSEGELHQRVAAVEVQLFRARILHPKSKAWMESNRAPFLLIASLSI